MDWSCFSAVLISGISLAQLSISQEMPIEDRSDDFCSWQSFNATCSSTSVIMMTKARYGRMRLGTCMERDYYIGCFADVIKDADGRCSGRRQCTIAVPDPKLHDAQPCPSDLGTYLEASYTCLEVYSDLQSSCHSSKSLKVEKTSGYLASIVTMETGYGSSVCPWKLHASPGQRINITLYDFGALRNFEQKDKTYCPVYAKIREPGETREATVCGNTDREKRVYTSVGNEVEVAMEVATTREANQQFIFKYEAVGCATPATPVGGWVQRDGDGAVIGCNKTIKKWHLVCQDTNWIGKYENCTTSGALGQVFSTNNEFPFGLVVSIVIGVVLGVVIGVTLLGLVLACRRRQQRRERDAALMFHRPYVPGTHDSGYGGSSVQKWGPGAHGAQYSSYAHIWELKQNPGQMTEYREAPGMGDNRPPLMSPRDGVARCQNKSKEHIYESPKFERKESCESYTDPPFYHEFDVDNPPVEGQGGNNLSNQNVGGRVPRYHMDDSRYSS